MRKNLRGRNLVGEIRTVGLRHNAHLDVFKRIAAVADDGRERRNAVRIHHHFAEVPLGVIVDLGAGGAADGHGGQGKKAGNGHCENASLEVHDAFLLRI